MPSKNDLFSADWSVTPSTSKLPKIEDTLERPSPAKKASPPSLSSLQPALPICDPPKPAPPPALVLEPVRSFEDLSLDLEHEQQTSPSVRSSQDLQIRVSQKHQLGYGRHATVLLGSYAYQSGKPDGQGHWRHGQAAYWQLCAAKKLADDKGSQMAGLSEALMLAKMIKCPQVVRYIGLKDQRVAKQPSYSDMGMEEEVHLTRPRRPPGPVRVASASSGTSLSTPSSPVIRHNPSNQGSVSTYFDFEQQSNSKPRNRERAAPDQSTFTLRRNATLKASKSPLSPSIESDQQYKDKTNEDTSPELILITEFYELGNLANFVRQHGPRLLGRTLFFKHAIDLLKAIVATHDKNIIHADVKPQNCMLDDQFNLKLGDYSSSLFNSPNLVDGLGLGTTQYAAPELVKLPPSAFSFPIDVFSAGLTLLFMITAVEPYESLTTQSSSKLDRLTPKSPKSHSRNASGTATPISRSRSSSTATPLHRHKFRSSSGAGKMVEMHLHLQKGHAWEWEERRRIEELEDGTDSGFFEEDDGYGIEEADILLPHLNTKDLLGYDCPTRSIALPSRLSDPSTRSSSRRSVYSDGHTPVQTFLTGQNVVPERLRILIREMVSPDARHRPLAGEALSRLQAIEADACQ